MDDKNNTGHDNTGNRNTGTRNTGHDNTGHDNTGHDNTGNRNTGNRNTGNRNTGTRNTGHDNTGHDNTGNRNTGDWNKVNRSNGFFNTIQVDEILIFNKPYSYKKFCDIEKPSWLHYFSLTNWIYEKDMSDAEKESNPTYKTTGGFLKTYEYQEAAKLSWDNATHEDKMLTFSLPNFDYDVAQEIFGIDFRTYYNQVNTCKDETKQDEEEYKTIVLDGIEYKLTRV